MLDLVVARYWGMASRIFFRAEVTHLQNQVFATIL